MLDDDDDGDADDHNDFLPYFIHHVSPFIYAGAHRLFIHMYVCVKGVAVESTPKVKLLQLQ